MNRYLLGAKFCSDLPLRGADKSTIKFIYGPSQSITRSLAKGGWIFAFINSQI
jgi:hypothetical protein